VKGFFLRGHHGRVMHFRNGVAGRRPAFGRASSHTSQDEPKPNLLSLSHLAHFRGTMAHLLFSFAVMFLPFLLLLLITLASPVAGFVVSRTASNRKKQGPLMASQTPPSTTTAHQRPSASSLYDPSERDATYGSNIAQYLIDLHDNQATFNFCGGLMFQLVLSDRLREHLETVAAADDSPAKNTKHRQPTIFTQYRMHQIQDYQ
jgi:hypothetical protein